MPDANLLSTMADLALLVVSAGRTPLNIVQRAVQTVGRDRIAGVILNRAEETVSTSGYDYYRYYGSYGDTPAN